jgi:four helix bundle protein
LAREIFEISKSFPKEEKYSLTDHIRRSSQSVTSNIAESWAKRRYEKAFVSKLTDSLGEEYETENWLDYSKDCHYIQIETHERVLSEYDEVRKMLISIINNPEKWSGYRNYLAYGGNYRISLHNVVYPRNCC